LNACRLWDDDLSLGGCGCGPSRSKMTHIGSSCEPNRWAPGDPMVWFDALYWGGKFMRVLALVVLLITSPAFAQDSPLVGNWKLVSFQTIYDGNESAPQDMYGANPNGYLILTQEGRLMTLITSDNRKAGAGDAERAALHKSMISYSGKYKAEGKDFITTVDASWNEAWNRTEQRRHFRIEGDKLTIETAPGPSILIPGKIAVGRLVWAREK
jgi:hypothetical protein